jgi:integrase
VSEIDGPERITEQEKGQEIMASISTDRSGHRRILFKASDGPRKTIHLGKISLSTARGILCKVERLIESRLSGQALDADTASWVRDLDSKLAKKLVRVGLVASRQQKETGKLGPLLRAYVESRVEWKPSTKIARGQAVRHLVKFFGEGRDLRSINAGHADDFKQWLLEQGLSGCTIHKHLQVARSLFHAMRRRKIVDENPFDGVRVAAVGIRDRQRFVTRAETTRVLEACPNHHWRMIVALARYGGLRCPSEVLSLRWPDIDWAARRITVHSPKTEHHPGKATRVIPLFPELRPILEEALELAPDGAEYVVDAKYRKAAQGPAGWANANLRTTFQKIVGRAGLEPWPRLFHNLRASRETELVEQFPIQVVAAWLGNTPTIAMRHYLMTTDEHFAKATEEVGQKTTQKTTQQARASAGNASRPRVTASSKALVLQGFASECDSFRAQGLAEAGLEPARP